jgi:hypothetical protein
MKSTLQNILLAFALAALGGASGGLAAADCLTVTFHDGVGDEPSTAGDVTNIHLEFDPSTGNYTATWTAVAENPFNGALRLNLNMRNASVGPGLQATLHGIFVIPVAPTTQLSYSGNSAALMQWNVGDLVSSFGAGFGSAVVDLDGDSSSSNRDHVVQSAALTSCDPDGDGDGVPDSLDLCPDSDLRPTVWIGGCDSSVSNDIDGALVDEDGCSLADYLAHQLTTAATGARNHGRFVSTMARYLNALVRSGIITGAEHEALMSCIGSANRFDFLLP